LLWVLGRTKPHYVNLAAEFEFYLAFTVNSVCPPGPPLWLLYMCIYCIADTNKDDDCIL